MKLGQLIGTAMDNIYEIFCLLEELGPRSKLFSFPIYN